MRSGPFACLSRSSVRRKYTVALFFAMAPAGLPAWGQDQQLRIEIGFSAKDQKEPHAVDQSPFQAYLGGTARFSPDAGGGLRTTDPSDSADGRFYFLPREVAPLDEASEFDLTVVVGARVSKGHLAATSVSIPIVGMEQRGPLLLGTHGEGHQDITSSGRRFGFALVSDGEHHDRDEVLLLDFGNPTAHQIIGRRQLPVHKPRRYTLSLHRGAEGEGDDTVTLSIDAPDEPSISAPLSSFACETGVARRGLLFGHEIGGGIAEADWHEVTLRATPQRQRTVEASPTVLAIGAARQLFIDDRLVESRENLKRKQGHPEKCTQNPVLRRDQPWEAARCELYGSAIWRPDLDRLQLFYSAMKQPYDTKLAFAESGDGGKTWIKPKLNQFLWEGSPSNIVWPGRYFTHGPCVVFDPHDPDASRRYKLFITAAPLDPNNQDQGPRGIDIAFSPDGREWTAAAGNPVIPGYNSDTGNSVFWDEKRQLYRAYVRLRSNVGRSVGLTESRDFLTWTEP